MTSVVSFDASASEAGSASSSNTEGSIRAFTPPPDSDDDDDNDTYIMADAFNAISAGTLARIATGEILDSPVLQCVQIKPMTSNGGMDRYRVVMNDTVHFIQGMLTQRAYLSVSQYARN